MFKYKSVVDADSLNGENCWASANNVNNIANMPFHNGAAYLVINYFTSSINKQLAFDLEHGEYWVRYNNGSWAIGVPSFYKDYNTLSALANGVGLKRFVVSCALNEEVSIVTGEEAYFATVIISSNVFATFSICLGSITKFNDYFNLATTEKDHEGTYNIYSDSQGRLCIQNKYDSQGRAVWVKVWGTHRNDN